MAYSKVIPGQRVAYPARDHNGFCDAAEWFERTRWKTDVDSPPSITRGGVVQVVNQTGTNRDAFEIVKIGQPVIDEDTGGGQEYRRAIKFTGEMPASPIDQLGVLQSAVPIGAYAYAVIAGFTMANVYLQGSDDMTAGVDPASTQGPYVLTSGAGNVRIISAPPSITDEVKLCAVEIERKGVLFAGKPKIAMQPGTIGEIVMHRWDSTASDWVSWDYGIPNVRNAHGVTLGTACMVRVEHIYGVRELCATPWQFRKIGDTGTEHAP